MFRTTYLDCEFLRDDLTNAGLISLGLTDREGTDYYAINANLDEDRIRHSSDEAATWLREHVWPLLPTTANGALDRTHPDVKPITVLREEVGQYYARGPKARLYAYYGGQDGVRLQGLWEHDWGQVPPNVPLRVRDLADLAEDAGLTAQDFPAQATPEHHALWDAQHDRAMHDTILKAMGLFPSPTTTPIGEEELRTLAINGQRRGTGGDAGPDEGTACRSHAGVDAGRSRRVRAGHGTAARRRGRLEGPLPERPRGVDDHPRLSHRDTAPGDRRDSITPVALRRAPSGIACPFRLRMAAGGLTGIRERWSLPCASAEAHAVRSSRAEGSSKA